jgi:hypothetical protein
MEWKYRKDFQVLPGIYLKYGSGGIETQIRPIESIPDKTFEADKLKHQLYKPYELQHEIKSASIDKLTSCELLDFKTLLFTSDKTYSETSSLLNSKTTLLNNHSQKLDRRKRSFFKFLFKKSILRMEQELPLLSEEVNELKEQLHYSSIKLEIDSEDSFSDLYKNVMKAFNLLNGSQKIWDFTSSRQTNRVAERTSAANTITRSEISISEKHLPILRADLPALCFHNINGGDLYLYPGFMLVYESKTDFAVISFADLKINFSQVRFIESEQVPTDTKIVDKTWFKVNKDGSPDKRFSSNYQIPIVAYGEIHMKSSSGLNEVYCFSNSELAMLFQKALSDYTEAIQKSKAMKK